jgi:TonB family protein
LHEQIDLVVVTEEKSKTGGLSIATVVSLILHSALVVWFVTRPEPKTTSGTQQPLVRYVQLLQQNEQQNRKNEFVEAPGPEVSKKAPLTAPLSNRNRQASMPEPTGPTPTNRPGDGRGLFTPQSRPQPRGAQQAEQPQPQQQAQQAATQSNGFDAPQTSARATAASNETFVYREPAKASAAVDLRAAAKAFRGPIGGGDGLDLGNAGGGGDKGYAEQGPLSFETQWYDWGDYAQSMVSRIRVNWYANMPQLIRTGIAGVVTIRFTIQRDGRITDVILVNSSGHPPYDFAARKAIELSSPLNPLPQDFPNPNERVTAMFYYNRRIN